MDKIIDWIKSNILLAIAGALAVFLFLMPGIFKTRRKAVKHGPSWYLNQGKPLPQRLRTKSGRPLPRSVGVRRANRARSSTNSSKGYAAAGGGTIPFKYNKDGSVKKAWQVSGTLAAKQRMQRLRRQR